MSEDYINEYFQYEVFKQRVGIIFAIIAVTLLIICGIVLLIGYLKEKHGK